MNTFEAQPSHDVVEILVDDIVHQSSQKLVVEAGPESRVVCRQWKGATLVDLVVLQEPRPVGVKGTLGPDDSALAKAELKELAKTVIDNSGAEGDADKRDAALKDIVEKSFEKPADDKGPATK